MISAVTARFGFLSVGRIAIAAFFAIVTGLFSSNISSAATLEICGEIELVSYISDRTNSLPTEKRRIYTFKCVTDGSIWQIESDFVQHGFETWSFDGTNVFRSLRGTSDPGPESTPNPKSHLPLSIPFSETTKDPTVYISESRDGHPLGNLGVNIPWLAYCSGSFIKRSGRVIPLPTTEIRNSEDSFAYTDQMESFSDTWGLPRSLKLFTSRLRYAVSVSDPRLLRTPRVEAARIQHDSRLEDGLLKFDYAVSQSTNISGISVPTKFAYTSFRTDQHGKWSRYVAGNGILTSLREMDIERRNPFDGERELAVVDFRLRHETRVVDGIIYRSAVLQGTNAPQLQATFYNNLKDAPLERSILVRRSRFFLAFAILLASVLAILLTRPSGYGVEKIAMQNIKKV